MKKNVFLSVFAVFGLVLCGFSVDAATSRPSASNKMISNTGATSSNASSTKTVSTARSAAIVPRNVSTARSAVPTTTKTVSTARSAVRGNSTVATNVNTARSAGMKQTVLNYGTGVNVAQTNTAINQVCLEKFQGCMDSFCMLDNVSGGRCACSDKKADLDYILNEIQELDAQSYKMATEGVEYLEMGKDAEMTIDTVNEIVSNYSTESERESPRKSLDMSAWNTDYMFQATPDLFSNSSSGYDTLAETSGDALFNAVLPLCMGQIPECSAEFNMLQLLYAQNIKSDCTAFENELKRQKTASEEKLATAEKALREAALVNIQAANKWDLGQCTVQFKNCMATTGGCGSDFTNCVGIAAAENARLPGGGYSNAQMYDIEGANTKISVYASTIDALDSKKPLCMNITDSCVAVKDQVWDTFLREVGPQLKTAELVAESNLRTSCISNISSCFQKACLDTIDPNDPDGSYDLCLSRPEAIQSLCKVEIEPCVAAEPLILDFVYSRLAAMRVDACTTQVKECLTDENRCGDNYANCVGLDTDTIIRMCPAESLTSCQESYSDAAVGTNVLGDDVYEELATLVQGIMLDIDNSFLAQCQAALDASMIKVCGSTENCNSFAFGENVGAGSLEYRICDYTGSATSTQIDYSQCRTNISQISDFDLGRGGNPVTPVAGVITGIIYWSNLNVETPGVITEMDDYMDKTSLEDGFEAQSAIENEFGLIQKTITSAISSIESDPTVQYCMSGRTTQGMNGTILGEGNQARFPELTASVKELVTNKVIQMAVENYDAKFEELTEQMSEDYVELGVRIADINDENEKDARREYARLSCISIPQAKTQSMSDTPGRTTSGGIINSNSVSVAMALVTSDPLFYLLGKLVTEDPMEDMVEGSTSELSGSKSTNSWNYKEKVVSTFGWADLTCTVCTTTQNCEKPKLGRKECKEWRDPIEDCKVIQF